MTLADTRTLVDGALASGTGLAAFNIIQLEHAQAILAGAEARGAAVILQLSENAIRYHRNDARPLLSAAARIAETASVPVSLHLDHATSLDECKRAAEAGVTSVMIDVSTADYATNTTLTAEAVDWGHAQGLWVEAELGEVGGKSAHAAGARTDPEEAAEFVNATGVDGLAVAIGSSHAMVEQTATLDLHLLARIRSRVQVPLVLHGSSGVPDVSIRAAVVAGITKVNVSTQLNRVMTDRIRQMLLKDPGLVDPRIYLGAARDDMTAHIEHLLGVISTAPATVVGADSEDHT